MSEGYAVAPIFLIRMAGVPFESVESLGTPQAIATARDFIAARAKYRDAKQDALDFFASREQLMSQEAFRAFHAAVRLGRAPVGVQGSQPAVFTNYAEAATQLARTEEELAAALDREVEHARQMLWRAAREHLPRQLIFAGAGARELLPALVADGAAPNESPGRRNTRAAERERHLLLYLQRISTKNDSFSEFGPTSRGWYRAGPATRGAATGRGR